MRLALHLLVLVGCLARGLMAPRLALATEQQAPSPLPPPLVVEAPPEVAKEPAAEPRQPLPTVQVATGDLTLTKVEIIDNGRTWILEKLLGQPDLYLTVAVGVGADVVKHRVPMKDVRDGAILRLVDERLVAYRDAQAGELPRELLVSLELYHSNLGRRQAAKVVGGVAVASGAGAGILVVTPAAAAAPATGVAAGMALGVSRLIDAEDEKLDALQLKLGKLFTSHTEHLVAVGEHARLEFTFQVTAATVLAPTVR